MTVARPQSPHLSKQATGALLIFIWMVSIMVALPTLLYSTTLTYGDGEDICLLIWPDGNPPESVYDHIYQIVFFLVTYMLPMLGLTIAYSHLGTVLWRTDLDNQTTKPRRCQKDKRKVCLMFNILNPS